MTGRSPASDPEIPRLRDAIADDLIALRWLFGRRLPTAQPSEAPLADQLSRILRGNPAWAVAAAAGALAGLVLAARSRLRGSPEPAGVPPSEVAML